MRAWTHRWSGPQATHMDVSTDGRWAPLCGVRDSQVDGFTHELRFVSCGRCLLTLAQEEAS